MRSLLEIGGLGALRCNVLMLGYKWDWCTCDTADLAAYVGIVADAFDKSMDVLLLRTGGKRERLEDLSVFVDNYNVSNQATVYSLSELAHAERGKENCAFDGAADLAGGAPTTGDAVVTAESRLNDETTLGTRSRQLRSQLLSVLRAKAETSYIDVWWLYDDGGLSMLVPHLLRLDGSYLADARLRVFTSGDNHSHSELVPQDLEAERKTIEAMLDKFRISVALVTVVDADSLHQEPCAETQEEFSNLIEPFYCASDEKDGAGLAANAEQQRRCITDGHLEQLRSRTHRHLRTAELIRQMSTDARLIVLCVTRLMPLKHVFSTMPIQRQPHVCTPPMYMAWLEMLTRGHKQPMLLVRGNQKNVLTLYA